MTKYLTRIFFGVLTSVFLLSGNSAAQDITNTGISVETSVTKLSKWTLPDVTAHAAILTDASTGEILFERDSNKQMPPASTTKILTAILALEMAEINEISTVSEKADLVGESSIYLNKGNRIKLGELIEGALIRSGNDACVAIAEQTAGSLDEFVRLMNIKAVSLGAYNSNFTNPHGLPDKNHYTTAYDLSVIARYAMNNPVFAETVAQKYSTVEFEQPRKSQEVKSTNKLLWNYALADGIKTGTTNAAGKCLIASASKDGRRLICVLLNAPDRFGDAQRLMEWGFNNTSTVEIGQKGDQITTYSIGETNIPVVLGEDVTVCVEKTKQENVITRIELDADIGHSIKSGEVLGYYYIYMDERLLKKAVLISGQNYENNVKDRFLDLFTRKG